MGTAVDRMRKLRLGRQLPIAALLTALVYAVLPFADFLNDNRRQGVDLGTVAPYALLVALPALAMVLAANLRKGVERAERVAVTFAAALFVFFNFRNLQKVLDRASLSALELEVWAVVFVAVTGLAYVFAARPLVRRYVLIAGLILLVVPMVQYTSFRLTEAGATNELESPQATAGSSGGGLGERPNIYFFVLDGYARDDQLAEQLGFDNRAFTSALEDTGFQVAQDSHASYPSTHLSIASTLEMRYLVTEDGEVSPDREDFYRVLRGENATVRSLRKLGYRYAVAPPGYWPGTRCSGIEDLCVDPIDGPGVLGGLGETDWAVMGMTPLAEAARRWVPDAGAGPYNEPDNVLDALREARLREPYFVYSHMMNPHPPYRYHPDCSSREVESGLEDWFEKPYLAMVRCANRLMSEAVERIVRRDPGAVIVIQGDHGTAFSVDTDQEVSAWSASQVEERLSPLNAVRLPEGCRGSLGDALALVNTLRTVLACVRDEPPDLVPFEAYVTNEDSGEVRRVTELLAPAPRPD